MVSKCKKRKLKTVSCLISGSHPSVINYDRNKVDFIVSMALHQVAGHENEESRGVDEVEEEKEDSDEEEAEQQDIARLRDLFND